MTVHCSRFARMHRNIELHQTGAPRSHGREHCRFETASALKRGANVRRSPPAPSLTRPFTIGTALRDLNRLFATSAVTDKFCVLVGSRSVRRWLKISSVVLRPLLGAGYGTAATWCGAVRSGRVRLLARSSSLTLIQENGHIARRKYSVRSA